MGWFSNLKPTDLTEKLKIPNRHLLSVVILWIIQSYILYAFFYFCREGIRFFTGFQDPFGLIVLSDHEQFWYNGFYASLASALGYMLAWQFLLRIPNYSYDLKFRFKIKQAANNGGFVTWTFLLWFTKIVALLGIWYIASPTIQYDINFLKEYWLLLLLLPIVLFLGIMPQIMRLAQGQKLKWFGVSCALFLTMSFGLANKDFVDFRAINKKILDQSVVHRYQLESPRTSSLQKIERMSLNFDIYMVRDKNKESALLFFGDTKWPVSFDKIDSAVNEEISRVYRLERSLLQANLHIDKDVPMKYVNDLLFELRKEGISYFQFSTGAKNAKYPANCILYKDMGLQFWCPAYNSYYVELADSVSQLDPTKYDLQFNEKYFPRLSGFRGYNRIRLDVSEQGCKVNGQMMSPTKIEALVKFMIKQYSPNYLFILNSNGKATYGQYVAIMDLLYAQIDSARNLASIEMFDQPFNYWYGGEPEYRELRSLYPRNVVRWTREEKELLEWMKN